ncbi:MAG: DUF2157 domain-containing protein [Oscillatoria sp. SIO1A7]|nr:DUF2157 domain-containing protein [Oscillatoria sp. SIO1A7]
MKISRQDFDWAADAGIISTEQAESLWMELSERNKNRPQFNLANVAYYFGALIIISGMTWFMGLAWEQFGGSGIFLIASLYALFFVLAGRTLWYKQNLRIPGGLLFTIAVCMTPLAIYGLQRMTGIWPSDDPGAYQNYHMWVKGSWLLIEVGTILAGLIALKFVKFPFLTAPIAFSLWYMSMDLTPLLFGEISFTWEERLWVSFWFGLAVLIIAYLVDRRTRKTQEDFAFWLYLFGLLSFWFGMTLMGDGNEWDKLVYCMINVGLVLLSLVLKRRVFIVFGAMGVFVYLSHLAYVVFEDSLLFPFALTVLGIGIIYSGSKFSKHF